LLEARSRPPELLTQTIEFWRRWVSKCRTMAAVRDANRSALML